MALDLVDHGPSIRIPAQVHQQGGVKVAHAAGPHLSGMVELLHSAPRAVVIAEGNVDEVQVQIVQPQLL